MKIFAIIAVVILLLAGAVAGWYWGMYKPEQAAKEKARLELLAQEEAEKKAAEEAAEKKARYDELITDGDAAFEQEDWETARVAYVDASTLFPDQSYPKDQLVLVNDELDRIAALEIEKGSGLITSITSATGQYYVVVSSSIDDDLAMDYASELAGEGYDIKVLQRQVDGLPYHGVAVGDYSTWDEASAAASGSSFAGGAWVLRY